MILAVVMHAGYSIEVGIVAALGTALLIGAINGVLIAYLGMPPSWSRLGCCRSRAAWRWSHPTTPWCSSSGRIRTSCCSSAAGVAVRNRQSLIYMLVLALLTGFLLHFTRFGRYVFAIGGNEHAAIVTGVPVRRTKIIVYMISALSAGIAG